MNAADRVIAVCEGGPLDGIHLSAPLEDGKPAPLTSRTEVVGVLYVPANDVAVPDDLWFNDVQHERAVRYIPEGSA